MPEMNLGDASGDSDEHQTFTQPTARAVPLRVYLLTVWQEAGQATRIWRFRLEDPQTRQQRGFLNAQELMALLEEGALEQQTERKTNTDSISSQDGEQ